MSPSGPAILKGHTGATEACTCSLEVAPTASSGSRSWSITMEYAAQVDLLPDTSAHVEESNLPTWRVKPMRLAYFAARWPCLCLLIGALIPAISIVLIFVRPFPPVQFDIR